MSVLVEKFESILQGKGVNEVEESTRENIRKRIESELGNSVHIFLNVSRKLVIVPDNLPLKEVVSENMKMQRELDEWNAKSTNINNVLDKASSYLRSAIQCDKKPSPWPYHPHDVHSESFNVPQYLERFLMGLLTDDAQNKAPTQRVSNLIQSFSQDMICAVTGGNKDSQTLVITLCSKNTHW